MANIINSSVSFGIGSIARIIGASNTSTGLIAFGYDDTLNSGAIAIDGKLVSSKILNVAKVEDTTNGDYVQVTYLDTEGTVQNTSFGIINKTQVQDMVDQFVSDRDEIQDTSIGILFAKDTEIDSSIDRLDSSVSALETAVDALEYVQTITGADGIDATVTSAAGTKNKTYTVKTIVDNTTVFNKNNQLSTLTYAITAKQTATSGFAKSYDLVVTNPSTGATSIAGTIDIPKDFLVKSGTVQTVETAGTPYTGAVVGDKYLDFVVNSKDGDDTDSHIYIPVKDLVDIYTGDGDGSGTGYITVDNNNVITWDGAQFKTDIIDPIVTDIDASIDRLDASVSSLEDQVATIAAGGITDVSAIETLTSVNVKIADSGVTADTVSNAIASVDFKQQVGNAYEEVITINDLVKKSAIDEIASLLTAAEVRQNTLDASVLDLETKVTEIDSSIDRLDASVSALENTLKWVALPTT